MLYTTTITIRRPAAPVDVYDATPDAVLVGQGIPAHIGQPSGSSLSDGSEQETVTFRLDAPLVDLIHGDIVTDDRTGLVYSTVWSKPRQGLGLDHTEAAVRLVTQRSPL